MLNKLDKRIRRFLAATFRGKFPRLYTTLDNPIEVPVQVAAYDLVTRKCIKSKDSVLDVGFGLGYGMKIMSEAASLLTGIEIDRRALTQVQNLVSEVSKIREVRYYDGYHIPFDDKAFDIVTCVDVIEHVPDYMKLITEMLRVSKRIVFISTPNRRPEHTNPDGLPKNRWHLREWSPEELGALLDESPASCWEWNFINGPWQGPFTYSVVPEQDTQALAPILFVSPT